MSDKEKETSSEVIDISLASTESSMELPLFRGISAGFPSPSMDFIDLSIDLQAINQASFCNLLWKS